MEANKYLKADLLDILFEGKNKDYGAYDLRLSYQNRLTKALGITLILCLIAIGAVALSNYLKSNMEKKTTLTPKNVVLQEVNIKQHNVPPPAPPPAPEPLKIKPQVKYTPLEVVEDKLVKPEEQPPDLNQIKKMTISTVTKTGDSAGISPALLVQQGTGITSAPPSDKKRVFRSVEQMPSFPGGENALMKYLRDHIHYPVIARENGIQGTIVVRFVVNTDGSIVDVETVGAKKGGGLEEEAIHVVKEMPEWKPGKQNGRSVRVEYNLPIQFRLQ